VPPQSAAQKRNFYKINICLTWKLFALSGHLNHLGPGAKNGRQNNTQLAQCQEFWSPRHAFNSTNCSRFFSQVTEQKKNGLIAKKIRKKFCGFWFVAHCKSVYIYTFCEYFRGLNETLCIVAGIIEGGKRTQKRKCRSICCTNRTQIK